MKKTKKHQTRFTSIVIVIVTVVLAVALFICLYYQADLESRFNATITWLSNLESDIAGLDSQWVILLCIFALYLARFRIPIPFSILCAITGICFSINRALIINVVFMAVFYALKYLEGRYFGGGWLTYVLNIRQVRFVKDWVTFRGSGNPYILVVSRLVPSIPAAVISRLYGSMHYDFLYYICLSILGYLPRLYIYTRLGAEIFNPFSWNFIVLLIIVVIFTGLSTLIFNIFYGARSNKMNQTLLIYSQKEKYKIVL